MKEKPKGRFYTHFRKDIYNLERIFIWKGMSRVSAAGVWFKVVQKLYFTVECKIFQLNCKQTC